ncbi:MAG: DUF2141 domain-containing protein [Sideroxydans sp.]|nr:DUF2141 domain-containing protein [Sideroxydans sp.]
MKHIAILAALLLPFASQAGELKLVFHGEGLVGQVLMVALFNSPETFLSDKTVLALKAEASGDATTLIIPDLKPGKYAISAFADKNHNEKLDTNFVGKPKELYGFSNDARHLVGTPDFAEASFDVGDGTVTQSIHLQ